MLTISELVYAILVSVVYGFVSKGSSFGTLIQGMSAAYVVIPYLFLMNTSYNKYRVVEFGWKNVLKNILGKRWRNRIANLDTISGESNGSSKDSSKSRDGNKETRTESIKSQIKREDNEPKDRIDSIDGHISSVTEMPTTSKGLGSQDKKDTGIPKVIPIYSSDEEDDGIVDPQEHKDKASKCKEILIAMNNVLDDEEIYI